VRPDVWKVILDAWSGMGQALEQTLPSGRGDVGVKPKPGDTSAMDLLRDDLKRRLADLVDGLKRLGVDHGEIAQALVPLTIHLDERVLLRLPAAIGPSWHRLQHDVIHSDDGGVVFYKRIDTLLRPDAHPSPLALELYYFCLNEGFWGVLGDDRTKLQRYKDELATAIRRAEPVPALAPEPSPAPSAPAAPLPAPLRRERTYYLVAAVVAILLAILIPLITRALLTS
jgi:type IV/VI secretion system ImpK/VasF family protein